MTNPWEGEAVAFWRMALVFGLLVASQESAFAQLRHRARNALPCGLAGQLVDYTSNHGCDRRLWSDALCEKRDLYVYLPPGFDPEKRYPLLVWLHGIDQDEIGFVQQALADVDAAMVSGKMPAVIIAMPDGSIPGRPGLVAQSSAFLNTRAGRFEDYLLQDVLGFVTANYPIRPEREAHVIGGVSMGGGSAFHHAIKHKDKFGHVIGVLPPLNLRWLDCHGRYFGNFDPECWGWRETYCLGLRPVGKFYCGLVCVPFHRLIHPLYGQGQHVIAELSQHNPIEMLDAYGLKEGELSMLVAYGGRDEFNIDAQVESFLFRARERGLTVEVLHSPNGRHDRATARSFLGPVLDWLAPRMRAYSPAAAAVNAPTQATPAEAK